MNTLHTPVGLDKTQLDTPVLLMDMDVMESNIARIAKTCRTAGVAWRPHMKGLKVPAIAHKAIRAGAIGVTCAKLGEAEVMAAAGITDILIANQIVGTQKIERLVNLRKHADLIILVDDRNNIRQVASAAKAKGVVIRVLIEVNAGLNRAGVEPGGPALELADFIGTQEGVKLVGVESWEGHATEIVDPGAKRSAITQSVALLTSTAELLREHGHPMEIVSCGGSGTFDTTACIDGVTEVQTGGAIMSDVRYVRKYHLDFPYALTIMSTVTSRPTSTRIVCDAGHKTMTNHHTAPEPINISGGYTMTFSAEHVRIDLEEPDLELKVGDRLEFIVGYSETTVNLHDQMVGVRDGKCEIVWDIQGRGRIR